VVGGISPLGQKTRLPIVVDRSAQEMPTVFVSAASVDCRSNCRPPICSGSPRHLGADRYVRAFGPMITPFSVESTDIDGLLIVSMKEIDDDRGTIRELFRTSAFAEAGVEVGPWLQVNATETQQGAIRGLHGEAMTKLVAIVHGEAFGAYADVRPNRRAAARS